MRILVFIIQAYEFETPEGTLVDLVTLELIGDSYSEALGRAKKIISKKGYRLSRVIEKYEKI